ncbi:hypothetical protein [Robertmurraya sp. FSL R5-0851]|uniref:hypothetical protein n=1 Tax=Robertmurraya sp. FSL R5-0851 TaxID=2921584 RepID=UPI0030FAA40E
MSQTKNISLDLFQLKYKERLFSFELPNDQVKFTALPSHVLEVQEGQFPIVIVEDDVPVGFFIFHSTSRVKDIQITPILCY